MKNNKVSSCEYINGEKIYIGDKVYRSGFGIATVYNIKKEGFKSQAAEVTVKIEDISNIGLSAKSHIKHLKELGIEGDFYTIRIVKGHAIQGFYKIKNFHDYITYSGDDMDKSNLTSGSILQDYDNNYYIFIKEINALVDIYFGNIISLNLYSNNLCSQIHPNLDIVKIANYQLNDAIYNLAWKQNNSLDPWCQELDFSWDLKRKRIREMTVEQICRELGEEIKIVR